MEVLFTFLNWTASFSHVDEESGSKMDIHNLATVITPNILYANAKTSGMDESFLAIEAIHSLIECNEAMCEVSLILKPRCRVMLTVNVEQVPEDLLHVLQDTSLFNGPNELTTKELIKRYGDIAKSPGPQRIVGLQSQQDSRESPPRNKDSRYAGYPSAQRIDIDPNQANAWERESSVRHVQGPGGFIPNNHSNNNSPPTHFGVPQSPYHHRQGSSETQGSSSSLQQRGGNNNNNYRSASPWGQGRPGQDPNQLGVTGAN
jgi:hypothetical protein